MGEVDRLPYKSLLQIVDVSIQYMFRYTNSDERCKRSAEEETISFSSFVLAAAFRHTAHVKEIPTRWKTSVGRRVLFRGVGWFPSCDVLS